jgi:hypothetical protein
MNYINNTNKFNCDLAYDVYSKVYDAWGGLNDKQQKKARRQVESMISEAGFRGIRTGLISEGAWQTVINKYRGIKPVGGARTAKEHPITYTNLSMYVIALDTKLNYDDYFAVWYDNLITTTTTSDENYRLQKFQKKFVFGVDCWKEMYKNAGIVLMERPNLKRYDVQKQWGLM